MNEIFQAVLSDLGNIQNDVISVILILLSIFVVLAGYYVISNLLLDTSDTLRREKNDGDEHDN